MILALTTDDQLMEIVKHITKREQPKSKTKQVWIRVEDMAKEVGVKTQELRLRLNKLAIDKKLNKKSKDSQWSKFSLVE